MRLSRRTAFFWSRRKGSLRSLTVSLIVLLAVAAIGWTATATLATAQPSPSHDEAPVTYRSGETLTFLAPSIFSDEDLGRGYPAQMYPLDGTRIVDGPIQQTQVDSTGTWLRRRTDGIGLNVSGTATGMTESTLSPSDDRQSAFLTVYRIERVAELNASPPFEPPSDTEANSPALLVTKVYYGRSLNVVIVGTRATFTESVFQTLRDRLAEGRPLRPVIEEHGLELAFSSRGLDVGYVTPRVFPIPTSWTDVESAYPTGPLEPVFAEYTVLQNLHAEPMPWQP
jgi:hypothetical protein